MLTYVVQVLVGFMEEPYEESKTLVFNAIDCIRHVFEITANPKNDFCRLFCKYGLLPSLSAALINVNNDKQQYVAAAPLRSVAASTLSSVAVRTQMSTREKSLTCCICFPTATRS